jgi:hypothetical protein
VTRHRLPILTLSGAFVSIGSTHLDLYPNFLPSTLTTNGNERITARESLMKSSKYEKPRTL